MLHWIGRCLYVSRGGYKLCRRSRQPVLIWRDGYVQMLVLVQAVYRRHAATRRSARDCN